MLNWARIYSKASKLLVLEIYTTYQSKFYRRKTKQVWALLTNAEGIYASKKEFALF